MELISRVLLAEEVRIVCGGFVGVVVAVLEGVHHQRSIEVGLHVWTDVPGIVDLHIVGEGRQHKARD